MKTALEFRLNQSITLTPQLQQAIRLLQLSSLELNQEVLAQLEQNPLLDVEEETSPMDLGNENIHSASKDSMQEAYQDSWSAGLNGRETRQYNGDNGPNLEQFAAEAQSLRDFLVWQMDLTPFSPEDRQIAEAIIDAINDDGFLSCTMEDIQEGLQENTIFEAPPTLDEMEAVLHRIQQFDPVGIGARTLQECLLVQCDALPPTTPYLNEAKKILTQCAENLTSRQYKQIMRRLKLNETTLHAALNLIKTLYPRPGNKISNSRTEYIVPDVSVVKIKGKWIVRLNSDLLPKLRINQQYAAFIKGADSERDSQFLKSHLQEARWFLKSIESRHDTLLKVAKFIVQHQQAFFEKGEEAMKPMVLADVAKALDMHESTISRVTTKKYMLTPTGILELKYFFSSHVATHEGGACSSTAIRAVIKKLVGSENPQKPLSDNKIAQLLGEKGIDVARRTIAKYRESLGIPPSHERKALSST